MTKLLTIMGFLGAIAIPSVASAQKAGPAQPDQIECPDIMRGLALTVRDVKGGIELEITTPLRARVPELREEARAAATELERRSKLKTSTETMSTSTEAEPELPPLQIVVRDISTGVRVTVRPERTSDLDTIRRGGHGLQEFWTGANCAQRTIPT